jgi:hypothetical protein
MEMYLLFKAMFEPYLHKVRKNQLYEELDRQKRPGRSHSKRLGF